MVLFCLLSVSVPLQTAVPDVLTCTWKYLCVCMCVRARARVYRVQRSCQNELTSSRPNLSYSGFVGTTHSNAKRSGVAWTTRTLADQVL